MPAYEPYNSKDYVIHGSFLTLQNKEQAWEQISGRMRTAVRKAQKVAINITQVQPSHETMAPFIKFCLNPDDLPVTYTSDYIVYFAYKDEKLLAGIVLKKIEQKLFMLCHANTPEARKNDIPSLLIWHVVEQWTGKECTRLDIGASYRFSLQKYFTGWQTEAYPMLMRAPELQPTLNLTPFDTAALGDKIPMNALAITKQELERRWNGKPYTFLPRAMYAIYTLIKWLKTDRALPNTASVWVTTTTDTHYVSSCVTSAIEQTMPLTRELTDDTAIIFCIHEFGFPHPKIKELRKIADERNIPLIEDCAYAWGTVGTGTTGDYTIYSLTKTFPLQFGGYIVGKHFTDEQLWQDYSCSDRGKREYTEARLATYLPTLEEAIIKRQANFTWYQDVFGTNQSFFKYSEQVAPGGYALQLQDENTMKETGDFVRTFGIEVANYWQNNAIVLPVHQRLEQGHLEYIAGSVLATKREWCGVPKVKVGS